MKELQTDVLKDPETLAQSAAEWLAAAAKASQDRFVVALSGGSTPKRMYQILAGMDLPWRRTHWFWGDERFVPPDDALSNYRMVREALFAHASIPAENIHPVPTQGLEPEAAAAAYEAELKRFYGSDRLDPTRPLFDITLLGLGPDGHTASLFPGTAVLAERHKWVAAVIGAKDEARITFTYPLLESSRHIAFLVAGAEKQRMLGLLRGGDTGIPAGRLAKEHVRVFADSAATGR
ncbi:MAG: 6-phosphogluconolactonase [Alphaproteobacteria bacterium]|nr:6-phosphogluconolactonase [Alphaproteobacteria bacterium]MBV8408568.1 6-phosphogluconolactonase [Alphaproteobacteria bacterium]